MSSESYLSDHFPYNAYDIEGILAAKGYAFFKNPNGHDLNIVGVRSKDSTSNAFNDWLTVSYFFDGRMNLWAFPATTDPGLFYRENPLNVKGTAIVIPGQYRGLWKIGKHRGKYTALVQKKAVKVWRDADRNKTLDSGRVDEGLFGINMHRSNIARASTMVGKWSAGCQVFQDPDHFNFVMRLCKRQNEVYGTNSFTYTLLDEEQDLADWL